MENLDIYKDIAERTDGDIYVGVVGPVRTGKSTFIKKFMELLVLPNIDNEYKRERAIDELPQSAAGKTIMTTEPKFIPNEAVEITIADNLKLKTRMVDCVGYLVNNAIGYLEDDMPRMVKTPWSAEEIPFERAAEIGTKKVIEEHSSIAILVTTDGSITGIPREDYVEPEERVARELTAKQKPFVIVLNAEEPFSEENKRLACELEDKYNTAVVPLNCTELSLENINDIFSKILFEFPIEQINIKFPRWIEGLQDTNEIKTELFREIKDCFADTKKLKEVSDDVARLQSTQVITRTEITKIDLGTGNVELSISFKDELFYKVLTEITGEEIADEGKLFAKITEFSRIKKEYDKLEYALHEVREKGYGIVNPTVDDLILEEPEIIRQGSKFGVKLKAKAPSLHMIRINTETEISPIVGSEKQSEELVNYLLSEFEEDKKKIWDSNIFGKSVHDLVNEGLQNKLARMPEEAQMKIQETLQRIVNEGSGGLICIIL